MVVQRSEDAVRSPGPILEGRMQRGAAGRTREPLRRIACQSVVESDRSDTSVELLCVAVLALIVT